MDFFFQIDFHIPLVISYEAKQSNTQHIIFKLVPVNQKEAFTTFSVCVSNKQFILKHIFRVIS